MLANARKDHSSPLIVIVNIIIQYIYLLSFLSPFSFLLLLFCVVLVLFYFWGGGGGVVGGGMAHKFGVFVRTVLWPLAPYFFSQVTRKS